MSLPVNWIPHNYQCTGISFLLCNPLSALFLDPGLGKTSISLAVAKILKHAELSNGTLLVAPLQVCYSVWPSEIKKWGNFNGLTHTILHGVNKGSLWGLKKDLYIINPEGLQWLHGELLKGLKAGRACPFDALIVDESTKFKNHMSMRFKYLRDMLPLFKRRHILTGTPAAKSLLDLWAQIYILDKGESLGKTFYEYRKKYFEANDWNKYDWQLKDFCEEEIHARIAPLALDMKAEDYLDMPELLFNNIEVELPKKAMKLYKTMEKEMFIELDSLEASAETSAQMTMKCHQMANGNVYEDIPLGLSEDELKLFKRSRKTILIHDAKIEALKNLVDELNGKPLLISYWFRHDLEALKTAFGDIPHIGSNTSPKRAKEIENKWNEGELPMLLGHPVTIAYGLNLQGAGNDVCFYSLPVCSLDMYIQFYRRIYRQGVKANRVRVHHLISKNTVDEAFMSRLNERAVQQTDLRAALRRYRNGF